ncbi:MAG TPA: AbrB/MazE/SpoVT family DNA-binding domain-containing protein [Gammaproteobacteria bacterium]|jgi:AbrB family looped-hinge helix DNA binding protein
MTVVTVSEKYQIVIPKEVRQSLGILPGQKIEVIVYEGRAEFVPVRDIKKLRGFLRGMKTDIRRDDDRV